MLDQLSQRTLALMATDVHAIGFAVADHDSVIGTLAVGNRPDGRPLEADAPFRIASISKVLTSTVVLQLADEGALHLDDPLRDLGIVPPAALDPRVGDVTVRQLLQHTSGIGKFRDQFFGTAATDWHTAANLALVSPLAAAPGTIYAYSNANFAILGVLVEQLTGQSLEAAVRERVLEPLGISNATLLDGHRSPGSRRAGIRGQPGPPLHGGAGARRRMGHRSRRPGAGRGRAAARQRHAPGVAGDARRDAHPDLALR